MKKWRITSLLVIVALLIAAVPAAANGEPSASVTISEDGYSFTFDGELEALLYAYNVVFCDGTSTEVVFIEGGWLSYLFLPFDKEIASVGVGFATDGYWDPEDEWYLWYDWIYVNRECSQPEPVLEYWGWNAGCGYPFVGAGVFLGYGWEEPVAGVEVTFTMEGEDPIVAFTDEWGNAWANFPFELGSDPVTIGIDAGEWGEASVEVSGPDPETCGAIQPFVEVSWPCGQEVPTATLGWIGDILGMDAYIYTEGDEQWKDSEGNSVTFEVIPGATYFYFLEWWSGNWEEWGSTDGEFAVPEECTAPAPESFWVPRYRMVTLIDADAPDWYLGQDSRNGTCWVKMPTSEGLPSVERQMAICGYDNGEQVYTDYVAETVFVDAWVEWNPVTGEVRYPDPMWDPAWVDWDYTTVIGPPIGP